MIKLTTAEVKILKLVCREFSPEKICGRLGISVKTYANHRWHLGKKTKTKTSIGLYKYAIKQGIV